MLPPYDTATSTSASNLRGPGRSSRRNYSYQKDSKPLAKRLAVGFRRYKRSIVALTFLLALLLIVLSLNMLNFSESEWHQQERGKFERSAAMDGEQRLDPQQVADLLVRERDIALKEQQHSLKIVDPIQLEGAELSPVSKEVQQQDRWNPSHNEKHPEQQQQQHAQMSGSVDVTRQDAVRDEFMYAWKAYKEHAWGFDDYHPVSRRGSNGYRMALTMVDALDTLIIMGLDSDYELCRDWIRSNLNFVDQSNVNVFETTIRVMGGLLASFALKKEPMFLDKAQALADQLLVAFDTPSAIPFGTVSFKPRKAYNPSWGGGASTTSEAGSIQLEWRYLSKASGNSIYAEKVDAASAVLAKFEKPRGLFTRYVNPALGTASDNTITLGARVDSIYEYFLKQWLQSGRTDIFQKDLYDKHVDAIRSELLRYTKGPQHYAYFQELLGDIPRAKMDHLVCFMPGMLALGADSDPDGRAEDMVLAKELMRTCVAAYTNTASGLAPEIMLFNDGNGDSKPEIEIDPGAKHNLLRPETVESLFIMWRLTHDPLYRDWGWSIFEAFKKHCRVPDGRGYSGLHTVDIAEPQQSNWNDHMESFFLGETLKYFYLLFSDDNLIPLNEWVFNTEAHPLPIFVSSVTKNQPQPQ